MPQVLPAQSNTYTPVALAGDQLMVDFSRNPKQFKLSRYTQIIPVKRDTGYYLRLQPDEAGRILNSDLRDFVWYDGADAPNKHDKTQEFEFQPFHTTRYAYEATLGYKAVEQAAWQIVAKHAAVLAQKAMTARTQKAANLLLDSANYDSGHVIDVSTTYGGTWAASDLSTKRILKSLNDAADKILDATLGAVTKDDLVLVMGTGAAKAVAQSTEILEMLKFQAGWDWVQGATQRTNVSYGVPETLYGYQVVVEETRKVTSKKGATRVVQSIWPQDKAALVARPGGVEGTYGTINFSAVNFFMYEEMSTWEKDDPDNRRRLIRVVDDYDVRMVAPACAVLFTNIA